MAKVALIVNNPDNLNTTDIALHDRLVSLGHTCDYISLFTDDWDYSSYDLIWTSYNVSAIIPMPWNVAKPAGTISYLIYSGFKLGTNYGYNTSQLYINITDNSHYITSPYSLGNLQFVSAVHACTSLTGFTKGVNSLGHIVGVAARSMIAYCEVGDELIDGEPAAGRRTVYGIYVTGGLNSDGWNIFDRMVAWLLMTPETPYPINRLKKGFIEAFNCFMSAYINAKIAGYAPLKLPDGTIF